MFDLQIAEYVIIPTIILMTFLAVVLELCTDRSVLRMLASDSAAISVLGKLFPALVVVYLMMLVVDRVGQDPGFLGGLAKKTDAVERVDLTEFLGEEGGATTATRAAKKQNVGKKYALLELLVLEKTDVPGKLLGTVRTRIRTARNVFLTLLLIISTIFGLLMRQLREDSRDEMNAPGLLLVTVLVLGGSVLSLKISLEERREELIVQGYAVLQSFNIHQYDMADPSDGRSGGHWLLAPLPQEEPDDPRDVQPEEPAPPATHRFTSALRQDPEDVTGLLVDTPQSLERRLGLGAAG
ncbi:hypothetical protein OAX78_03610, partial [Planctomycetota bacterium]|nr:hypothetical protein [Planctomycetota bacterium]